MEVEKKRPWWLDEYDELPDWLLIVLIVVLAVGIPIICTALVATGHTVLMMLVFILAYPLSYFICKYGHSEMP